MPWGKNKGTPMGQVDSGYLLWLFRQPWIKEWPDIYDYLVENQGALLMENETEDAHEERGEFTSYEDYMRYGRD